MSELDDALKAYVKDPELENSYYEKALETEFYVPLSNSGSEEEIEKEGGVTPKILESDGKSYIMLFDSVDRLAAWAQKDLPYASLSGAAIAQFSPASLYWAVNMGCEYAKEMSPDEINYMKQMSISGTV